MYTAPPFFNEVLCWSCLHPCQVCYSKWPSGKGSRWKPKARPKRPRCRRSKWTRNPTWPTWTYMNHQPGLTEITKWYINTENTVTIQSQYSHNTVNTSFGWNAHHDSDWCHLAPTVSSMKTFRSVTNPPDRCFQPWHRSMDQRHVR